MTTGFGTKVRTSALSVVFAAGLLAATAASASADTYKFYNGGNTYTGPYSGAGTVYEAIQTGPLGEQTTDCPNGAGSCPSDVVSDPMTFTGGTSTLTATANDAHGVWDDLTPEYGGLGVSDSSTAFTGDDQILGDEILTLTFNHEIKLLGIATLFAGGHTPFGSAAYDTVAEVAAAAASIVFDMKVDGGSWTSTSFLLANTVGGLGDLFGTVFSFRQHTGTDQPTFYVSGLLTGPGRAEVVPIPAALPLFMGGLGALALLRRRKHKAMTNPA